MSAPLIGLLSALASALVWGGGDFVGGLAAYRRSPYQIVALASLAGVPLLLFLAYLANERIPPPPDILWATAGGISGAVGVAALYRGLSTGSAAIVAPTAGVVGAAIPVIVGSLLQGLPPGTRLAGITVGLVGIGLVSKAADPRVDSVRSSVSLSVLAGTGFGGFFVFIAQLKGGLLFAPLVIAKLAAVALACLILVIRREPLPSPASQPIALLAGALDAGGNFFYLLAVQLVRLDVAAVLTSMYPATTVILSAALLHERIRSLQMVGVGLCLTGLALIAL
ncbi:MAG TPA: DMT family transporter [Anaerolineales bacterium]|nr:DMT family transporter [Anaerolineales bacterium]